VDISQAWAFAGIVDEHELPVPLDRQLDESCHIVTPFDVRGCVDRVAAGCDNTGSQSRKAIWSTCAEYDFGAASGKQERCCFADAAAGARDDNHLAFAFPT
jgi:hypothetical protein